MLSFKGVKTRFLGVFLGDNINELNGLAVGAAGGSNMCLVLPPPYSF